MNMLYHLSMTGPQDPAPVPPPETRVPRPEVVNTGYPGALAILGAAVLLFGTLSAITGGWFGALVAIPGGIVLLRASFRSRREQRLYFDDAERRDLLARNICPNCHYDRTGLAQHVVCPECGVAVFAPPICRD